MSVFKIRRLPPICLVNIQQTLLNAFSGRSPNRGRPQVNSEEIAATLAIDSNCILVGELDGKPVAYASFVEYDNTYCHGGFWYVEPKYVRRGYGMELTEAGINNLLPSHVITFYVQDHIKQFLAPRFSFYQHWKTQVLDFDLHSSLQKLDSLSSSSLYSAKSIDEVNRQSLANYDAMIFGYRRQEFLEKWFAIKDSIAKVAVNNHGDIVGFVASRVPFTQECADYLMGPLYANSTEIATVLLRSLFEDMVKKCQDKGQSPSTKVVRMASPDINKEGIELNKFLGYKTVYSLNFMTVSTTRELPKGRFSNWYGITSVLIG